MYEYKASAKSNTLKIASNKKIDPLGIERINTRLAKPEFLSIPSNSSSFNICISLKFLWTEIYGFIIFDVCLDLVNAQAFMDKENEL